MRLEPINKHGRTASPLNGPRELMDEVAAAYVNLCRQTPHTPPWIGYFAVIDQQCIGSCGFKALPADDRVEIAYFTFPGHEACGHATEMARQLITIAHEHAPHVQVAAQTLPESNASTAILTKLGFTRAGDAHDDEVGLVWEWRLT